MDDRFVLRDQRLLVDVRPIEVIYGEWLNGGMNFLLVVGIQLLLAAAIPMLSPMLLVSALVHWGLFALHKDHLPYRYPAGDKEAAKAVNEKANGIFFFGNVNSGDEYQKFKEIWLEDDDCRKHLLILGSTGSGKSETLKGIFFNALCWASGYFVADGKADNKLPTDSHTMARSFGRDDDLLILNFLLAGMSPEMVRRSRVRRTNKLNPVSTSDSDTIIQMGANLLPKAEGDGKAWQEKALNLWRAVVTALCYMRDNEGFYISVPIIIDYLALPKVEELFLRGYNEAQENGGQWSYGYAPIKAYLETGCPGFKIDKLLAKHGLADASPNGMGGMVGGRGAPGGGKQVEQSDQANEQHAYRTGQLMPVLNLLDKTYGYIFRDKYPEIDMIDVTMNNRILVMLIPSLEKSAQEAENLGKLAIACLRVMMGKNLGAQVEGTREAILDSKATASPYPYIVALDELAYYFSDGIAVMFAQARSLGFMMVAAAQDLEKLTEGSRQAEAGAMTANAVAKYFMRIDDANKTWEFIKKILGEVKVARKMEFDLGMVGFKRGKQVRVDSVERKTLAELKASKPGEGIFDSAGRAVDMKNLYVGDDLKEHANPDFWVLRFLQVEPPSDEDVIANSIPMASVEDPYEKGRHMLEILQQKRLRPMSEPAPDPVISAVAAASAKLSEHVPAVERAAVLFEAARKALLPIMAEARDVAMAQAGEPAATATSPTLSELAEEDIGEPDELDFLNPKVYVRKAAQTLLASREDAAPRVSDPAQTGEPVTLGEHFFATVREMRVRRAQPQGEDSNVLRVVAKTLPREDEGEGIDGGWIRAACGDATEILRERSERGGSVVGFTADTLDGIQGVEEVLGNPHPEAAAKAVEQVVSARVTPTVIPEAGAAPEDIERFFNMLGTEDPV